MTQAPERGFLLREFEVRLQRAQRAMHAAGLDALLLTTEAEVRYFSGFQTQFWESPTRPWFLILPLTGKPIAVIPEIGAEGMGSTWVEDIRTWPAPVPEDDGVSLLADSLAALPRRYGAIGTPMGHESHLRMPLRDFLDVQNRLRPVPFVDAAPLLRGLRFVKSAAEVEKIRYACQLTSDAFEALPEVMKTGQSEREICRDFRIDLLCRGADHSPYIISGSGPGGYDSIIMGPTDRVLSEGDLLIIDTGTVYDGYFCDFDRNFAFGHADDLTHRSYDTVFAATGAGFDAARPGARMCDVWQAMWTVLEAGGALGNSVGRMGHGLGMQLTEGPSVTPDDETELLPGAVITLEPGMAFAPGRQMVHEENIVITEPGAEWLSRRASAELPVIA